MILSSRVDYLDKESIDKVNNWLEQSVVNYSQQSTKIDIMHIKF